MTSEPNQHVQNGMDAESFLASVRDADAPTVADKDRARAALAAAITAGVTVGAASKAAAATQTAAGAASFLGVAKVAVPLVLLLGGAGLYFAANRTVPASEGRDHAPPHRTTPSNVVVVGTHSDAVPPHASTGTSESPVRLAVPPRSPALRRPAPTVANNVAPAAVAAPQQENASDLNAEMLLLRQAQVALRDGRAADALQILDAHEARFVGGVLAPERAVLRARAEQRLATPNQSESDTSPTPPEH